MESGKAAFAMVVKQFLAPYTCVLTGESGLRDYIGTGTLLRIDDTAYVATVASSLRGRSGDILVWNVGSERPFPVVEGVECITGADCASLRMPRVPFLLEHAFHVSHEHFNCGDERRSVLAVVGVPAEGLVLDPRTQRIVPNVSGVCFPVKHGDITCDELLVERSSTEKRVGLSCVGAAVWSLPGTDESLWSPKTTRFFGIQGVPISSSASRVRIATGTCWLRTTTEGWPDSTAVEVPDVHASHASSAAHSLPQRTLRTMPLALADSRDDDGNRIPVAGPEFEALMRDADRKLSDAGHPVRSRSMTAWHMLTGKRTVDVMGCWGRRHGESLPCSLLVAVDDWYKQTYPSHSLIPSDWGPRLIVIRNEVFRARIPTIFNPSKPLDAYQYIVGLSGSLKDSLSSQEKASIQTQYNAFFAQASELYACLMTYGHPERGEPRRELLMAGWHDLRTTCDSYRDCDPGGVLFAAQQAVEKYLKSYLLWMDAELTIDDLKKRHGHDIEGLHQACVDKDEVFKRCAPHIGAFLFDASVRYQRPRFGRNRVIETMDIAHGVCHLVAHCLLVRPRHSTTTPPGDVS